MLSTTGFSQWIAKRLPRRRSERGQTLVEYVLIIALVSLAAIAALGFMSGKIQQVFSKSANTLNNVQVASGSPAPPPSPPPNGTTINGGNSTGFVNANGSTFYSGGAIQQCLPETVGNLIACGLGGGTWVTVSAPGVYYALPFAGYGTPCAFTYTATGYAFSGTWVAAPPLLTHLYRVGTSGGPDYGAACT